MEKLFHHEKDHNLISAQEIVPIIMEFITPQSVLDVGCGIGSWLSVYKQYMKTDNYLGIDAEYVDENLLKIPKDHFIKHDLRDIKSMPPPYTIKLDNMTKKFDLTQCLEVAEHLPNFAADDLVNFLTKTSDVILFSAAIPGQTGENHINEQWPDYWEKIFNKYDYIFFDPFRKKIWNNPNIAWWYKQNILLALHKNIIADFQNKISNLQKFDQVYVHPECLKMYTSNNSSIIDSNQTNVKKRKFILLKKIIKMMLPYGIVRKFL